MKIKGPLNIWNCGAIGIITSCMTMLRVDHMGYTTRNQEIVVLFSLMLFIVYFGNRLFDLAQQWCQFLQRHWLIWLGIVISLPFTIWFNCIMASILGPIRAVMLSLLYAPIILVPTGLIIVHKFYYLYNKEVTYRIK